MRREEYERTYGRRSHVPPPLPSPQEDPRSRRSRTKMKCLISIGLILPALAAVIGVAAWAVSADVVMNSGSNRGSKPENNLLQGYGIDNDNRPDIFRMNEDNDRFRPRPQSTVPPTTTQRTTSTSSTTSAPLTLSPKEETDVNAILSKLISASGAASGGSGPRFVVVAPLPDTPDLAQGQSGASPVIARADRLAASKVPPRQESWRASDPHAHEADLTASASSQSFQKLPPPHHRPTGNLTNRVGLADSESSSTRRIGEKPVVINLSSGNHRTGGFNSRPIELTGFEPFDSMMSPETLVASPSLQKVHQNPPSSFSVHGSFPHKRGPPQGIYGSRNPAQHFEFKDQHVFNPHVAEHTLHGFKANPPPGLMSPHPVGIGLKPIQQQLHHIDNSGAPSLLAEESNRWGSVGFHPPPSGAYVHKPPEGISLSISSPANNKGHVSAEPVSVIKSFFLPFLPKPRLNMNARVVFGVVLDKGMGLGANKKEASHHPFH